MRFVTPGLLSWVPVLGFAKVYFYPGERMSAPVEPKAVQQKLSWWRVKEQPGKHLLGW